MHNAGVAVVEHLGSSITRKHDGGVNTQRHLWVRLGDTRAMRISQGPKPTS